MSFEAEQKVRQSGITDRTLFDVLLALAYFQNQQTGECYPSTESIACESRVNDRLVRTALKRLFELGYVTAEQKAGGRRVFHLHLDRLPIREDEHKRVQESTPLSDDTPLYESTVPPCRKVQYPPVGKCSTPLYENTAEQRIEQGIEQGTKQGYTCTAETAVSTSSDISTADESEIGKPVDNEENPLDWFPDDVPVYECEYVSESETIDAKPFDTVSESVNDTAPQHQTETIAGKQENDGTGSKATRARNKQKRERAEKVKAIYSEILPELSQPIKLDGAKREGAVNARWNWIEKQLKTKDETAVLDYWREKVFKRAKQSAYLLGIAKNSTGWRADFEYLVSERGFINVLEGKFDNRESVKDLSEGGKWCAPGNSKTDYDLRKIWGKKPA